ncbi:MAG TPA: hypothetical protein P5239_10530, partial [Victivallales bacterium]|nr:hypothetical protein [Victivallales bacterium]
MRCIKYLLYFLIFLILVIPVFNLKSDTLDDIFRRLSKTEEKEALILARKGEYEKAIKILEPLFLEKPESPQIASLYIWLKIKANQVNEAWNIYSNLEEKNIISDDVKKELFKNFALKEHEKAVIMARDGKYDEALEIIDKCIKLQPDNHIFKADKILIMLWKNDKENALQEFKRLFPDGNPPEYLNDEIKKLNEEMSKKDKSQELEKETDKVNISENTISSDKKKDHFKDLQEKAVELARNNKYEDAIKIFKEIFKSSEKINDDIINDYIVVLSWSGADKDAVEFYENNSGKFKEKTYLYKNLAKSYFKIEKFDSAFTFYKKALDENPSDIEALKGMSFVIFAKSGEAEAIKFLENYLSVHSNIMNHNTIENVINEVKNTFAKYSKKVSEDAILEKKLLEADDLIKRKDLERLMPLAEELSKYSDNPNALIIKVYALQIAKKTFDALELNEKILKIYPDYTPSINTKYHILLDIGAAQLANEKLKQSNDKVSPEVQQRILGDLAAEQIKFLDPKRAIKLLDQNINYYEEYLQKDNDPNSALAFKRRAQFDKFLAMRQAEMMEEIIEDYESLKKEGVELPYWVLEAVGDAYLYMKKPEKAIVIYNKIIEYYKENNQYRYPNNYNVLMAKYVALIELERHYEARKILEELDREISYFTYKNGILSEHWDKLDLLVEKAWSLIYDDRLNDAESYIEKIIEDIPYNSNPRIAQAYLHLYRGFPRLALEDFEIVTNLNP